MIVTEEEAKTKFCPHRENNHGHGFCVGSLCMMWRTERKVTFVNTSTNQTREEVHELDGKGYCGLAYR